MKKTLFTLPSIVEALKLIDNPNEIVQKIYKQIRDVKKKDSESINAIGCSLFYCAAFYGYENVIRLFLAIGVSPDILLKSQLVPRPVSPVLSRSIRMTYNYASPTALMEASRSGHINLVILLIEAGADVNSYDRECGDYPALLQASMNGHEEIVKILINAGANVNFSYERENGDNALLLASLHGHFNVVKLLIECGIDINYQNKEGATALMNASGSGFIDIVKLCIASGADVNFIGKKGNIALGVASYGGHKDIVETLLASGAEADTNGHDDRLISAVYKENIQMIEMLLQAGVNPDAPDLWGNTPLTHAVGRGNIKIIRMLIEAGADVNYICVKHFHFFYNIYSSILINAAQNGHLEAVKLLLDSAADINKADKYGRTALMFASAKGHYAIVKVLIDRGANINLTNTEGDTAFMLTCSKGYIDIAQLFIDCKVDVNAVDKDGNTALVRAVQKKRTSIVKTLIEAGADVNRQNNLGSFALKYPAWYGDLEIVEMLIEAGADVNLSDNYGNTALAMALSKGHITMDDVQEEIEFLLLVNGAKECKEEELNVGIKTHEVIKSLDKELTEQQRNSQEKYKSLLCRAIEEVTTIDPLKDWLKAQDLIKDFLGEIGKLFLEYFQFHLDEARSCGYLYKDILKNLIWPIEHLGYIRDEITWCTRSSYADDYEPILLARTNLEAFNSMFGEVVGFANLSHQDKLVDRFRGSSFSSPAKIGIPISHCWWYEADN